MDEISFHASVKASRQPNMCLSALLFVVLLAVCAIIVFGVISGHNAIFYIVILLPILIRRIQDVSNSSIVIQTIASMKTDGESLEINLPRTRSHGKEFIDQCYQMRVNDVEYIRISSGVLVLCSRHIFGVYQQNERETVNDDLGNGYISISLLEEDVESVYDFLMRAAPDINVVLL